MMTETPQASPAAVMLCGHGSRSPAAVAEFHGLAHALRRRLPDHDVESGFLEFARPVIRDGLEALKARGAKRILCLPGMLFAAANPQIAVSFGRELAVDNRLLRAASARIAAAEAAAEHPVERKDTLLMVVGRGTNDPDANSNVAKVARMLWEGMGFGWAEVSYSGVAYPLVDAGLARAVRLGFRRIIVFPYFLFTGILVERIYQRTDEAAAAHPEIEFLKAEYLNDHPLVIDAFLDRLGEAANGTGVMNCLMCKYREQVLGYETDQGVPQAGHHYHVRGIGTDDDHDHAHAGHDHGHGHHHHDHSHSHHHHPGSETRDRDERPARGGASDDAGA